MIYATSEMKKLSSSQISIAAEAFAAAQFALSGFDVLEQAGRARSFFDLAVAKSGGMMKVSVHSSFNGFWDLVDRFLNSTQRANITVADYHRAINSWLENQSSRATCCLVQFESIDLHRMPQLYLASPAEVARELHHRIEQLSILDLASFGLDVVHRLEGLPASWKFTQARIAELMELPVEQVASTAPVPVAMAGKELAELEPLMYLDRQAMMN
jgi:hypothetical protein